MSKSKEKKEENLESKIEVDDLLNAKTLVYFYKVESEQFKISHDDPAPGLIKEYDNNKTINGYRVSKDDAIELKEEVEKEFNYKKRSLDFDLGKLGLTSNDITPIDLRVIIEQIEVDKKDLKFDEKNRMFYDGIRVFSHRDLQTTYIDIYVCDQGHYGSSWCGNCGYNLKDDDSRLECPECTYMFVDTKMSY